MLDVAIIGAGPAGLSAAAALLRCTPQPRVQVSLEMCMVLDVTFCLNSPPAGMHAVEDCCLSKHDTPRQVTPTSLRHRLDK